MMAASATNEPKPADLNGRLTAQRRSAERQHAGALARERACSWLRLLTFFAAAITWVPLEEHPGGALLATIAFVAAFIVAVRAHGRARRARELADRLLLMLDESLRRCGGRAVLIRSAERPAAAPDLDASLRPICDDGPAWELSAQERDDLDLYGPPVGLFGLLNRTSTSFGARRLKEMLERPCLSADYVRARQSAVAALQRQGGARHRIMAATAGLRGRDALFEGLVRGIRDAEPLPRPSRIMLIRLWSIPSAGLFIAGLVLIGLGELATSYLVLGILLFNSLVYLRLQRLVRARVDPWKNIGPAATGYLEAAWQAHTDLPDEPTLRRLGEALAVVSQRPALPALRASAGWADSGGMIHALCNVVFFYDVHVASAILRSVLPHRDALLAGIAALAELEALNSLACFAEETADGGPTCYPTLVADPVLQIRAGRHPLIPPDRAVANDIMLDAATRLWVVTGPNMAGKSTLLRMCGVNCLLAQVGTVALAEAMSLAPVRLMTDLQVRDNLAENESYFLAEVRHLRKMVLPEKDGVAVLGLMDEPFRGTNSAEQVAASVAVVEHLLGTGGFFLLATHERCLADLAEHTASAENRHFREQLDCDGLVFDYRLYPGPADTRNALLVLTREGYPPAILQRAQAWLDRAE